MFLTSPRPRLLAAAWLVASTLAGAAPRPDAVVTINELHYNPPGSQDAEWIELHNQMAVNVDLTGWSLANGVSFSFPPGTLLPGGGFLVVAKNPGTPSLAGVPGVLGPYSGQLSNRGETVDLLSSSGRLMDRVEYADSGRWPLAANGAGATLAKRHPGLPGADPDSWRASMQSGGTPGEINFPAPGAGIEHEFTGAESSWRYLDAAAPAGWENPGFDDTAWVQGQGPFGTRGGGAGDLAVTHSLVTRHRAGALTGLADGAQFSTWPDTALDDGVAQDALAGGNPRYRTRATPSREPAVSFDGDDEYRMISSPGIGPTSGFVYFLVCKANNKPVSGGINGGSGAYLLDRTVDVDAPLASLKAVDGCYGFQKRYDDGSGLGGPVSTTPISWTQYQVVAIRRNPVLGRFELWVDGVMEAVDGDNGRALTPQPVVIGRHGSVVNGGFAGRIAEVLIYNDALSDEDFLAVGSYLGSRYGLDTQFPDYAARSELDPAAHSSHFRQSFFFTGDPSRAALDLSCTLADGAVFYLNGQEIARLNMPEGPVTNATPALSKWDPPQGSRHIAIRPGVLVRGENVLAVSLHAAADGNPALWFQARLHATETAPDPDQPPTLQLNEIASSQAGPFFIELRNPTGENSSTEGFTLELLGPQYAAFPLPAANLPPGGLLAFTEGELGWRPEPGDKVVLRAPDGMVADIQLADTVARGREDTWPGWWLAEDGPTPGAANHISLNRDVVLSEICYHPPDLSPESAEKQWLELTNRGAAPVDLGAWSFLEGVRYTFPPGTVLAPGGCLVLAKSPGSFPVAQGTKVLGPWSGSLSRSGERLLLVDARGNPANEVLYRDGGRWPDTADGGGSTLELRDLRADNSQPEAWAASEEGARRSWQTVSYRMLASPSSVGPDGQWREFVFGLLGAGEVLIDNLSVVEDPDGSKTQFLSNCDFSLGDAGWRFLGNHRHAKVIPDPEDPGNMVLHLQAVGPTEHMHNHVETTLDSNRQVTDGRMYEISYRVRWLSGNHLLNTRLYFNRCARTTALDRSGNPGTPGATNSVAIANAGPSFTAFSHAPAVPAPGQPVTVTTRAADPDGLASLTLFYAVNGGSYASQPMISDDGSTFTAAIPGQSSASVVRFYVAATDAAAVPATAFFPAAGPEAHALYQVQDGLAATSGLHNIRIVMDPADKALLYRENNVMSNERLGCTVIYDEREIYYNAGVRLKSSQRGRPVAARVGFNLGFNADQLFRGVHGTVAIDRSEGQRPGCQEILYDQMMTASGGVPAKFNDLCQVIAPNPANTGHAILQLARYDKIFLDSQFESGSDGTVHEYELIYYPTTADPNGYKLPQPDQVVGTKLTNLGDDKENYRWTFLIKNNRDRDDYSRLMLMAKQFELSGAQFESGLDEVIDIDQWLRALAYSCASGAGDSFFSNARHNGQFYSRPDGRVLYFPHDLDFTFLVTRSIFENRELQRLIANPGRKRAYLAHLYEICTTVFNQSYMAPWAAHFGTLLPGEPFSSHLSYINARSTYILDSIHSEAAPIAFSITTNGGADFTTASSPVVLDGLGWLDVHGIRLAGAPEPLEITWTSTSTWQLALSLAPGPNLITLEALDAAGNVIGSDSITVTSTGAIQRPDASNLVVSELYYNPPGADESTEYLELLNISGATLDLSGVRFTAGIAFTFPAASLLPPGNRILIVKDQAAFTATFGGNLPLAGVYTGNLSNSGELLELRRADGGVILSFLYSDKAPWPVEADGDGYSLVLIDPWSAPDHGDPRNWRASSTIGGSPGSSDTETYAHWKAAHGQHGDEEDRDGDGFTTRQEYLLGGNPNVAEAWLAPTFHRETDGSMTLTVTRRALAEGPPPHPETATDLTTWSRETRALFLGSERLPGTPALDRLYYRLTPPANTPRFFVRFALGSR